MAPICFLGLVYSQSFMWVICPQALIVMFIRQSQHAYDSLGAPDYPDLAVGLLYYPFIGWLLSRASRRGTLARASIRVISWHILAIGLAVGTGKIRNHLWGIG